MALGFKKAVEEYREVRIKAALNRIDLAKPGAVAALLEVQGDPGAPVAAYEQVAEVFPLEFHGGLKPASNVEVDRALGILRANNDKAAVAIRTGADITYENPPRLSTGSPMLDWLLGGGIPRGFLTQFKGAESLGKTFAGLKTVCETLRTGGNVLWVAAERFNKRWARQCGVPIHFSEQEIAELPSEEMRAQARAYNEAYPEGARVTLITGRAGNDVLQTVAEAVALNFADLIVMDSLAVLRRATHLENKQVGYEVRGGEAKLFNDFVTRLESAWNYVESCFGKELEVSWFCSKCGGTFEKRKDHKKCADGQKAKLVKQAVVGAQVRTAVVAINQIRDQGLDTLFFIPPDAPGGRGLRHAKGAELNFLAAEAMVVTHQNRPVSCGKTIQVKCTKSKVGPPERVGAFRIWYETIPGLGEAGSYDLIPELLGCKINTDSNKVVGLAEICGILQQNGAYYTLFGHKFHGLDNLIKFLRSPANAAAVGALRAEVMQWIRKGDL